MDERGLVYVGQVTQIEPITGADFIQRAQVDCGRGGCWSGVVKKNELVVGSLCAVYLQDSLLPQTEEFEFMGRHNYRVRMMRLRGVPSECLITPLLFDFDGTGPAVGDDITALAGVTKYEKPLPLPLSGDIAGHFPAFISKTDEPNFQVVPHLVEALVGKPYYITEKADGSSATVYHYNGHVGFCSRNYELKPAANNAIVTVAERYGIPDRLREGGANVALQFELVGPGIQGNPMGLDTVDGRLFSVYYIDPQEYGNLDTLIGWGERMPLVKLVGMGDRFRAASANELRQMAEGEYMPGRQREGIVIRPWEPVRVQGERLSFKVLNLNYKERG